MQRRNFLASMEPRARARGNKFWRTGYNGITQASMEPRARARGNLADNHD